jgi:hypothetical protein
VLGSLCAAAALSLAAWVQYRFCSMCLCCFTHPEAIQVATARLPCPAELHSRVFSGYRKRSLVTRRQIDYGRSAADLDAHQEAALEARVTIRQRSRGTSRNKVIKLFPHIPIFNSTTRGDSSMSQERYFTFCFEINQSFVHMHHTLVLYLMCRQ